MICRILYFSGLSCPSGYFCFKMKLIHLSKMHNFQMANSAIPVAAKRSDATFRTQNSHFNIIGHLEQDQKRGPSDHGANVIVNAVPPSLSISMVALSCLTRVLTRCNPSVRESPMSISSGNPIPSSLTARITLPSPSG
jgi:hypothetical protein